MNRAGATTAADVPPATWVDGAIQRTIAAPIALISGMMIIAARSLGRPAAWFSFICWALAFHTFVIAMLFGLFGLPEGLVRAVASWKELLILLLAIAALVRVAIGKAPWLSVQSTDLIALSLSVLSVVMLAWSFNGFGARRPVGVYLYGLRDATFCLLPYLIGRLTPELGDSPRTLRRIITVAAVVSLIGVLEFRFVTPEVLAAIGVTSYFRDFLNGGAFLEGTLFGLPQQYFTGIAGQTVQRSGSTFLSSQAFALAHLLALPTATVFAFSRARRGWKTWLLYALLWCGLLSTITRMTIVTVVLCSLLALVLLRRFEIVGIFALLCGAAGVVATFLIPGMATFLWYTLTWQTGSSQSHVADWQRGFNIMITHPFGSGLGTTGSAPIRYGFVALTADNLLLKYGVELGIAGLVLCLLLLLSFARRSWTLSQRGVTPERRTLGTVMLLATVGVLINGMTVAIFDSTYFTYLYFWLAGTVVSLTGSTRAWPASPST